jgi:hypothetical protein
LYVVIDLNSNLTRALNLTNFNLWAAIRPTLSFRSDASFYESKLNGARGRGEASKIERVLEYILRDVEDASLKLRLARAKRDEASNKVSDLEERNWALLSEFEAAKAFEEEMD